MKLKGVIEEKLKDFIEKNYLLSIDKIRYFPLGEDGASYIINCKNKKFFAKVYSKGKRLHAPTPVIATMEFLFNAHSNDKFECSPLPVLTKGERAVSKFNGFPVVVYEYISGGHYKSYSNKDIRELGKILASLHNLLPKKYPNIGVEDFDLKIEKRILYLLREVKKNKYRKNSSQNKIKNLLMSEEDNLQSGLEYLKRNAPYIKSRRKDFVITHTDLHMGNLMSGKNSIYLIDWDNICLALPEKDLMWFGDVKKVKSNFEKIYSRNLKKKYKFDKIAYKYYVIKRIIATRVFFAECVLYRGNSTKQNKKYIGWIGNGISKLEKILK